MTAAPGPWTRAVMAQRPSMDSWLPVACQLPSLARASSRVAPLISGRSGRAEAQGDAVGGVGLAAVVVGDLGRELVGAGGAGGGGEGEADRGGDVAALDLDVGRWAGSGGGGQGELARGELGQQGRRKQDRRDQGDLSGDAAAQGAEAALWSGQGGQQPVAVAGRQDQQAGEQQQLEVEDPAEAGAGQARPATGQVQGPVQPGGGQHPDHGEGQAGEPDHRLHPIHGRIGRGRLGLGCLVGAAEEAGQQPDQPAGPDAGGEQVQPLGQQVDRAQRGRRRRRGRPGPASPWRQPRSARPRPASPGRPHQTGRAWPLSAMAARSGPSGCRIRAASSPAAVALARTPAASQARFRPVSEATRSASDAPTAARSAATLATSPTTARPAPTNSSGRGPGREPPVIDDQAGGGRPHQQGQPAVQQPPPGGGQRRRRRRGRRRDRGSLGAGGWGGHADPEGEAPAADMAVVPGDGPPGHRVGPIRQRPSGHLELERLASHRSGLAGLDRPAVGVQHLDRGQPRLWPLGEGQGDLPGRPVNRRPVGRIRGPQHGVRLPPPSRWPATTGQPAGRRRPGAARRSMLHTPPLWAEPRRFEARPRRRLPRAGPSPIRCQGPSRLG